MGDAFNLMDLAKSMGMKTVDVAKEVKEAEATASEASSGIVSVPAHTAGLGVRSRRTGRERASAEAAREGRHGARLLVLVRAVCESP